mgnify:FL=1
MFRKHFNSKKIDIENVNGVLSLTNKILKIAYILIVIIAIYAITLIGKEWNVLQFFLTVIRILAPLFVGIVIAWLFNPFVTWLQKRGVRRGIGTTVTYFLIFSILYVMMQAIIPMLIYQINDFVKTLPDIFNTVKIWIEDLFARAGNLISMDTKGVQQDIFREIENFGTGLAKGLPQMTISFLTSVFSGAGVIVIGLIIGFYFLLTFDNASDSIFELVPKKYRKETKDLFHAVDTSLQRYVRGALIDCTAVFVVTSIGLWIVGLQSPLLFGLFCGITNIIPYAGPYIGGFPAVIVGFAEDPMIGLFTLLVIVVIQFVEGNFFQPLIMSKTTKLHPVTIMVGLLVFGHFWGILGMVVSTPIITSLKSIFMYFDEKYDILETSESEE